MRLRNIPEAKDIIEQYPEIVRILSYQDLLREKPEIIFANSGYLHLELGMGRGKFITTLALKNPQINYLGVEKYTSVMYKALLKIKNNPPPNLKLLIMDVDHLPLVLESNQVGRIYLNFSDPWPGKPRKRLTHYNKLLMYRKLLMPEGEVHFKTDNKEFFDFSLGEFTQAGFHLKDVTFDLHNSDLGENVMTEYEERFYQEGKRICRLVAKKEEQNGK